MSKKQILLLVDEDDKFLRRYEEKEKCHLGRGIRHRAFIILLFKNSEVLLQKRKHKLWDNYWDITAASHVLHLKNKDETYIDAGRRCLKREYGIKQVNLEKIGGFNYYEQYDKFCENEYCAVLIGKYNKDIIANYKIMYDYKWVKINKFLNDSSLNSLYTPWAKLSAKFILDKNIKL